MLLIDGVKYEEWKPEGANAEDELEQMVKEHAQDIFGENSIYLDKKQKLKSLAGVGSIPDGLVIIFGNVPEWHIVEVELSSHDPYGHIVPQVDRFLNGVDNRDTRNKIIEALYDAIYSDEFLKLKTRQAIGLDKDVHKFLADLITSPPTITIVIEEYTSKLREALKKYTPKKIVEFQTFIREGVGLAVHAHLFDPLYQPTICIEPESPTLSDDKIEINLHKNSVDSCYIDIPRAKKVLFPNFKTTVELQTNIGLMEIGFNPAPWGTRLQKGFSSWFKAHPELEAGDKVHITVLEPMKKYRLDIVK